MSRLFRRWFYETDDTNKNVTALKDDVKSATLSANPTKLSLLKRKDMDVSKKI